MITGAQILVSEMEFSTTANDVNNKMIESPNKQQKREVNHNVRQFS